MAVIVGTNAYVTALEYEDYATARGVDIDYVNLDADIIKSADFIDTYYNFKGEPVDDAQAMKLPTDCVTIADISRAALKAVQMQQAGLLTLNLASVATGTIESESKVLDGVGSKSITYAKGSQQTYKRKTPEIDNLLRPYIGFAATLGLVRV